MVNEGDIRVEVATNKYNKLSEQYNELLAKYNDLKALSAVKNLVKVEVNNFEYDFLKERNQQLKKELDSVKISNTKLKDDLNLLTIDHNNDKILLEEKTEMVKVKEGIILRLIHNVDCLIRTSETSEYINDSKSDLVKKLMQEKFELTNENLELKAKLSTITNIVLGDDFKNNSESRTTHCDNFEPLEGNIDECLKSLDMSEPIFDKVVEYLKFECVSNEIVEPVDYANIGVTDGDKTDVDGITDMCEVCSNESKEWNIESYKTLCKNLNDKLKIM